jgi:hypothetical protein
VPQEAQGTLTQNLKDVLRIKLTAQIICLLLLLPRLEGEEKGQLVVFLGQIL